MGIFDGIVGGQAGLVNASHEDELQRQRAAYEIAAKQQEAQMQQLKMQAYNQAYGPGAIAGQGKTTKVYDPNESEACMMPLSNLIALWAAKYGDKWVARGEDTFWADALMRLRENGCFERIGDYVRLREEL